MKSYVVSNQQATNFSSEAYRQRRAITVTLWSIQIVLALVFLFAGSMKLVLPIEVMTAQIPLPGLLLRFIGVCEVAGALGLILPGLTRIQKGLTSLAACGLVIIMVGAVVLTLASQGVAAAVIPLVVGSLAACIAYGRRSWIARV
ncbi:MAG: DoxX family protein [Ktedonobacteraceae bacterium]|nr:DoxX family protein [Ktedonobacteraceae bacterium]